MAADAGGAVAEAAGDAEAAPWAPGSTKVGGLWAHDSAVVPQPISRTSPRPRYLRMACRIAA